MQKTMLMDTYPVYAREFAPGECRLDGVDAVIDQLRSDIEADPVAGYIAVFDQKAHTEGVGGTVAPDIAAAKNLVFCFGQQLGNAKVLAIRPRSIGVAAGADGRLTVSFMAPPNDYALAAMTRWVDALAA